MAALGWQTVIDVSIIAFAFFFLYRTLRTSGTWKIVAGIFIAGSVFFGAYLLDLKALKWIYSHVSHIVLLALIVVFQPEIRKIFEKAATLRTSGRVQGGGDLATLLAESVFRIRQRGWGALIVLPGRESIERWVAGGISIHALPSVPLFVSIFDPHSPGHDGAAIVEDGRITRIAVRLPLTQSDRLPPDLGTRHNASAGLAEVTDALVIAVSEERGTVTLFSELEITRADAEADVAASIQKHWKERAGIGAVERSRYAGALPQLVTSVLLAFAIWVGVIWGETLPAGERILPLALLPNSSRTLDLPVVPQLVGSLRGARLISIQVEPATVRVRVDDGTETSPLILPTSPVALEGVAETKRVRAAIVPPEHISSATGKWPDVEVTLVVEKKGR